MLNLFKVFLACGVLVLLSACSIVAPNYQPDFKSVNDLKNSDVQKMSVGMVLLASPNLEKVSLRGTTLSSPYNDSYADYFKNALEENLKQSGLWEKNSNLVVSCEVLRNDVDASGFSTGTADLEAKFVVKNSGSEVYNKTHSVKYDWPSSFLGAVAIPNAQKNYGLAVQKLMDEFFTDPTFLAAVKK
jgi:hypothetical protein